MSTAFRANSVYCVGVLFMIYCSCVCVFVQVSEEAKEGQALLAGVQTAGATQPKHWELSSGPQKE